MRWKDVNLNPSVRILRQFGVILAITCAAFACRQAFVRHQVTSAVLLFAAGSGFAFVAAIRPVWLKVIFVASIIVTFPIGWVVSNLILMFLFFGIMTPLAFVFRFSGRDALNLLPVSDNESSFWSAKKIDADKRSYFKQF
jgi:hypothetical protein